MKKQTSAIMRINERGAKKFLATMKRKTRKVKITTAAQYSAAWESVQSIDAFLASPFIEGVKDQKTRLYEAYKYAGEQLDFFVKTAKAQKEALLAGRVTYQIAAERRASVFNARQNKIAQARAIQDAKLLAKKLRAEGAHEAAAAVIAEARRTTAIVAPFQGVEKSAGSVRTEYFDFEVTKPKDVPQKYWAIDESLIRKDVNAFGLACEIPGVKIWKARKEHSRKVKHGDA
jgi:hypothetical protein